MNLAKNQFSPAGKSQRLLSLSLVYQISGFCFGLSWGGGCIVGEILSPSILLNFCSILDEILLFRLVGLLVGGWVVGWCWFGFGFSVLSPILSVFLCSTSHLIVFLFSTQSSMVLDGLAS